MNGDIIAAGTQLSFNYGAYDQDQSLIVALKVFDVTTVASPVLVATVAATRVFSGMYVAQWTPTLAGKSYATYMQVYTDMSYTTEDPNRSPDVNTFETAASGMTTLTAGDIAAIAAAVWDSIQADFTESGTFGGSLQGNLTAARADNLDNLDDPISVVQSTANTILTGVSAIEAQTNKLLFDGSDYVLAHTEVNSDKDGYELDSTSIAAVAGAVWDVGLAAHLGTGSTGAAIFAIEALVQPSAFTAAVWDVAVSGHSTGGTFGEYIQVINTSTLDTTNELADPGHGLLALANDISNAQAAIITAIDGTNSLVNAIPGDITASQTTILTAIAGVSSQLVALNTQDVNYQAALLAQFSTTQAAISTVDGHVLTLQNNTTSKFIVPPTMVIPGTGSKNYQFELRLYDAEGNPKAPDFPPTITMTRLDTGGTVFANQPMTEYGSYVGAYYYNYSLSSASDSYPAVVEAAVTEASVVTLVPQVTEVTAFEGDLEQVITQLTAVQTTVEDIDNLASSGVYGFAALQAGEVSIQAAITALQSLVQMVKNRTDNLPNIPAAQPDCQATTSAVLTALPTLSEIQTVITTLQEALQGPDNRNMTEVYDVFDLTPVAKTNDPRFAYLNVPLSSLSTLDAPTVWGYVNRTLTAQAGLSPTDIANVWAYLATSAPAGSMGARIGTNLNAQVSALATLAQIAALLDGLAQDSTVAALNTLITTNDANILNDINNVAALATSIKGKTDQLPSDPASEGELETAIGALAAPIAEIGLDVDGIKAKTDNLPAQPASQLTLELIPTNPLLDDDGRLLNLDARVSLAATQSEVAALITTLPTLAQIITVVAPAVTAADNAETAANAAAALVLEVKASTDNLPDDPAAESAATENAESILTAIGNIGPGSSLTAAEVWAYSTRTLTYYPPPVDISSLATHSDVAALNQYENLMSTSFNAGTGNQEIIAWATQNGQVVAGTNCTVTVKGPTGVAVWSDTLASPNSDGVFQFINTAALTGSLDYYVVIAITVGGQVRTSQQPFVTVN